MDWPPKKLSEEQAIFVRINKVEGRRCSWRYIAQLCAKEWGGTWEDNQLAGQDICRAAAEHFNEDWMSEEWN